MRPNLKQDKRVQPRPHIIHQDAGPSRQSFQTAQRKRLHYVKATKEYKTRQNVFPMQRNTYESDHLAGYLVDDDNPRILLAAFTRYRGRNGNAHQRDCS